VINFAKNLSGAANEMTKLLLRSFSGIQVNNDKTNAKLLTIQRKKTCLQITTQVHDDTRRSDAKKNFKTCNLHRIFDIITARSALFGTGKKIKM
jgi:hypothetical protein